jgi:hypothetical protein
MLEALTSADDHLAANASVYALPVPLCMDSGSLVPMLRTVLAPAFAQPKPGASPDGQVSAGFPLFSFLFPEICCSPPDHASCELPHVLHASWPGLQNKLAHSRPVKSSLMGCTCLPITRTGQVWRC